jgi:hypothetical protein
MVTFEDFPNDIMRQVWYSNELGNSVWICVNPKADTTWYEIKMKPKGQHGAHTRKCYSFNYALDIANEEESLIHT